MFKLCCKKIVHNKNSTQTAIDKSNVHITILVISPKKQLLWVRIEDLTETVLISTHKNTVQLREKKIHQLQNKFINTPSDMESQSEFVPLLQV